jgi:hypothetical protein
VRYGGGVHSARTHLLFVLLAACSTPTREAPSAPLPPAPPREEPTSAAPKPDTSRLDDTLVDAARDYPRYARVGDLAWAPTLCAAPFPTGTAMDPPTASRAAAGSAHGDKLFWVFAQDRTAYAALTQGKRETAPAGLSVVKEAWRADPADAPGVDVTRTVKKDGHVYVASAKVGLFLMAKLDASTPGTDAGWIYGTASADGTNVRRATDADSCAGCHRSATHDRIFGPATR